MLRLWCMVGALDACCRPSMTLWFPVMNSARRTSPGGRGERRRALAGFFTSPQGVAQRRYEALRAYFVEGASAAQAAKRFGYAPATMLALVRDCRPQQSEFFIERRPGPRVAPAKQAARERVLALRAQGRSVTEIAATIEDSPTPLNRTGVWELLREEGIERLAPRPPSERGVALRDHPPRVRVMRWPERPFRERSSHVGLMLLLPALVALDLPAAVRGARLPGTREVPALCSVLFSAMSPAASSWAASAARSRFWLRRATMLC